MIRTGRDRGPDGGPNWSHPVVPNGPTGQTPIDPSATFHGLSSQARDIYLIFYLHLCGGRFHLTSERPQVRTLLRPPGQSTCGSSRRSTVVAKWSHWCSPRCGFRACQQRAGRPSSTGMVLTAPLSGRQVVINGRALCPSLTVARGCDPWRPGTAVHGGAPAAKRGRTTWTVRGQVEVPGDGHHGHGMWLIANLRTRLIRRSAWPAGYLSVRLGRTRTGDLSVARG